MKPNRILLAAIGLAAVTGCTAFASSFAQNPETIRVDIHDIANEVARNTQTEVSQIPRFVQAPIDVAAIACGIPPDVLAKLIDVREGCIATTTSPALEQIVNRQVSAKQR